MSYVKRPAPCYCCGSEETLTWAKPQRPDCTYCTKCRAEVDRMFRKEDRAKHKSASAYFRMRVKNLKWKYAPEWEPRPNTLILNKPKKAVKGEDAGTVRGNRDSGPWAAQNPCISDRLKLTNKFYGVLNDAARRHNSETR